jgi:four helix bundle protein
MMTDGCGAWAIGRKNKNRGYQELRVWQDAIEYYALCCRVFRQFPRELLRVASNAITSSDSVHRNIAEGYCRRSIREYLSFLNIALGSLGESVSGLFACQRAQQITEEEFRQLDALAYKLENGLIKLVGPLEQKREAGDWVDHLVVRESNAAYAAESEDVV